MLVDGKSRRTVWIDDTDRRRIRIIDQTLLPWEFRELALSSVAEMAAAISTMKVRGAGCIGACAAYGMYLAALESPGGDDGFRDCQRAALKLKGTRPTAVNLAWAVDRMLRVMRPARTANERISAAWAEAHRIADEDVACCRAIGQHGLKLFETAMERKTTPGPLRVLTHCNAGWLAFVDIGSATAPIYAAHDAGMEILVWVDETRPRNQGAALTPWELGVHGVPHRVVVDNAGGHLMSRGLVDLVLTGADRVTRSGDVVNKIGTYLKALAACDNGIPFHVALPSSTLDMSLLRGDEAPVEERDGEEVATVTGLDSAGRVTAVRVVPNGSEVANPAFDVTPARLVTSLITEKGVLEASESGLASSRPMS